MGGLSAIKSGVAQLLKNEIPIYELVSGAALAFAALLLIIPGFLTDLVGFFLIMPITRNLIIKNISSKFKKPKNYENIIEGEIEEDNYDEEKNKK